MFICFHLLGLVWSGHLINVLVLEHWIFNKTNLISKNKFSPIRLLQSAYLPEIFSN